MQVEREITSALSSGSSISATLTRLLNAVEPQRRAVFETCIAALNTGERLQTQVAKDIIGCLLFEVPGKTCVGLPTGLSHANMGFSKLVVTKE